MVIVKANKQSEAGVLPDEQILTEMGKFNQELEKAGLLLAGEGLQASSKGARVRFAGSKRTVIDGPFTETKELIESELFGHEKGSFTGAAGRHVGKFEQAEGGTIFLDEIGDMPLAMQAKLLRVLEEGEVERIGGDKPIPVDVRVVVTTHRDLQARVREGKFRQDLFHRVYVFPVALPPLRERRE